MRPASFDYDDDEIFDADDSYHGEPSAPGKPALATGVSAIDPDEFDKPARASSRDETAPAAAPSKYEWHLTFAMLVFFVIGSALYLACSIVDYQWGQTLLELPEWLRTVDDDMAWVRYRLEEQYGDASKLEDGPDWEAERRLMAMKPLSLKRRLMREQGVKYGLDFLFDNHNNLAKQAEENVKIEPRWIRKLQQTPEELYYDLDWDCLPPDIQAAYAVLGYYEDAWNKEIPVPSDSMLWYELSPEMQEAALFIGYTEMIWCSYDDDNAGAVDTVSPTAKPTNEPTTAAPSVTPTRAPLEPSVSPTNPPSGSPTESPTGNPTSSSMPTLSGFIMDEDGNMIPRPTASPSRTPTEAPTLTPTIVPSDMPSLVHSLLPSANPSMIPSSEAPTSSPIVLLPGVLPDAIYYDEWWKDLPEHIQDAYEVLEWNETAWNKGMDVATENMTWAELSEEQQEAAGVLGYDQELWDTSDKIEDIVTNTTGVDYETYTWDELPRLAKLAAETLGWTEDKWDNGNGEAWSDGFYWSQLPPEAQLAAAVLGYDELSWNSGGDTSLTALLEEAGGEYISNDDDYVFMIGKTGIWVSQYTVLYFFAALSFVFTGILELANHKKPFHVLMILAGLFGVASAVFNDEDIRVSIILDAVSVHLYLLEGVGLLLNDRYKELEEEGPWARRLYTFADSQFLLGAILDVIMAYFWLFDESADWDQALQITWVLSACLWVNCALIYTGLFIKETIKDS